MFNVFVLLAISTLTLPSRQETSANKPIAEVPFTLHQNAVIMPAVINGRDTVRLLLDTERPNEPAQCQVCRDVLVMESRVQRVQ